MMKTLTSECPCRKEYGTSQFLKKGMLESPAKTAYPGSPGHRKRRLPDIGKPPHHIGGRSPFFHKQLCPETLPGRAPYIFAV